MAQQHAHQSFHQNPGTLAPGQTIAVGQFNVQVERYLSQGGFAHVYLVRTATPVYNTTHHVLKRIAVANESMLREVKKEVDVMRLLKGHPNIVHLIDAAWHKMSNGMFEVFILMEYCPGGGIIDMMNRRLRERLTEAEILQIFVDVCEGVAFMHNARPPLLHRDLKVENILQSSPTSYKLCDFGSATIVSPRAPATTQEIRALEADLNRHTTLQYRAPEMVDPYLRRPIDEKSDVWALGVLLYKLCYYTTPFEEHGPLAILNVQYKTPPYPVYSTQMNGLIASMLREHGVQRPSAFEILANVHQLRGTKSKFQYTIPAREPLSPRQSSFKASLAQPASLQKTKSISPASVSTNAVALEGGLAKSAGVQAREMVLEAIAPMRRGRPKGSNDLSISPSRQTSPHKKEPHISSNSTQLAAEQGKNWMDAGFDAEGEKAWKAMAAMKVPVVQPATNSGDPWSVNRELGQGKSKSPGFGDDFGQQLWDSFDSKPALDNSLTTTSTSRSPAPPPRIPAFTGSDVLRSKAATGGKDRDAFDGLGLGSSGSKPAPTLAEARKLRTGLAMMSTPKNVHPTSASHVNSSSHTLSPTVVPRPPSSESSTAISRPSSSKPRYSPQQGDFSAEARFPSLEELDATFSTSQPSLSQSSSVIGVKAGSQILNQLQLQSGKSSGSSDPTLKADTIRPPQRADGARSEQVTGTAMRQTTPKRWAPKSREGGDYLDYPNSKSSDSSIPKRSDTSGLGSKSTIISYSISTPGLKGSSPSPTKLEDTTNSTPKRVEAKDVEAWSSTHRASHIKSGKLSTKDWLTGSDNESPSSSGNTLDFAGIRDGPRKQTSVQRNHIAVPVHTSHDPSSSLQVAQTKQTTNVSPGTPRRTTTINDKDAGDYTNVWDRLPRGRQNEGRAVDSSFESTSSADEGPEDANGYTPKPVKPPQQSKPRHRPRQSSVHDLVDLWGGGVSASATEKERGKPASKSSNLPDSHQPTPAKLSSVNNSTSSVPMPRSSSPLSSSPLYSTESQLSRQSSSFVPTPRTRKQSTPSASNASPVASRSRPQSMFLFPASRPIESSSSTSPTVTSSLSPPAEARPRPVRRTSISDMVQHYEAIGVARRTSGSGPGPVPEKPPELRTKRLSDAKKPEFVADTARFSANRASTTLQPPRSAGPPSSESRRSPTYATRLSPTGLQSEHTKDIERALKISRRPSPSPEPKPVSLETQARSPSPDRPYQGVGKLIDQWQRKAESDTPKPPIVSRRGGFPVKRAGISNSGRG